MEFEKYATQREATPFYMGRVQAILDLALTAFKAGRMAEVETLLVRGNNLTMEFEILPVHTSPTFPTEKDPHVA